VKRFAKVGAHRSLPPPEGAGRGRAGPACPGVYKNPEKWRKNHKIRKKRKVEKREEKRGEERGGREIGEALLHLGCGFGKKFQVNLFILFIVVN
jgi:hypothetical protein